MDGNTRCKVTRGKERRDEGSIKQTEYPGIDAKLRSFPDGGLSHHMSILTK